MSTDLNLEVSTGIDEEPDNTPYEPASERKVLIQPYDYAVRTLMDMITDGDLRLDPDYQRQYRWADEKASKFIESIALNIPVPVLYLAEEADGRFTVIDGQQRLTSLMRFLKPAELNSLFPDGDIEALRLSSLKVRPDMNDKCYVDLGANDRSAISKRPVRCIVVLNESDSTLKFEVFERLNTGSVSLTDQEVRNCIYRGSYNAAIKRMAANQKFQELLQLSENVKRSMKDSELVLRFLAYSLLTENVEYSGNYSEYLNNHMEQNIGISPARSLALEKLFSDTVDLIHESLGPGVAFRKPNSRKSPEDANYNKSLINGAIYESQMIAVSRRISKGTPISPQDLKARITGAFSDEAYWNCLFQGTAQRTKALKRNERLTELILA